MSLVLYTYFLAVLNYTLKHPIIIINYEPFSFNQEKVNIFKCIKSGKQNMFDIDITSN